MSYHWEWEFLKGEMSQKEGGERGIRKGKERKERKERRDKRRKKLSSQNKRMTAPRKINIYIYI